MATTRFHILLRDKILKEVENHSGSLATGTAKDYSQYQYSVGYVAGLQAALGLCEEIEKEFN